MFTFLGMSPYMKYLPFVGESHWSFSTAGSEQEDSGRATTTIKQQSFILCPEKFTVDKYMQREKLTIKKMSTAT